jgi:ferredoxin-like protein FixX
MQPVADSENRKSLTFREVTPISGGARLGHCKPLVAMSVASLCAFALWIGLANAQSNLPVQVQADLLQRKLVDAVSRGDSSTALKSVEEYRALKISVPLPMLIVEAKLSAARGDGLRAQAALEEYFQSAKSGDDKYSEALSLYVRVSELPDVQAKKSRELENRLAAERYDRDERIAILHRQLNDLDNEENRLRTASPGHGLCRSENAAVEAAEKNVVKCNACNKAMIVLLSAQEKLNHCNYPYVILQDKRIAVQKALSTLEKK